MPLNFDAFCSYYFVPPERFLKDVFDLVGCHHERLLLSLRTACSTLEPSTMEEAAIITQLLYQLAAHVGYLLVEMRCVRGLC